MRYIMRRSCLFLVMIAVIVFTGCGQKKKEDPVTVTLWHVYGGQTESPLNDLIDEFNETIGKEENIRVQVGSVTNTNTIHENVLASAFGDPGASKLPDMFVSYPKTVLAMPDDTELVDYYDYFTEEELKLIRRKMIESKTKNMGAYLRKMAIDGYIVNTDTTPLKKQYEEMHKIGVNINQIAKKVNTTGDLYPEEMQELKEMVKELWRILRSSQLK